MVRLELLSLVLILLPIDTHCGQCAAGTCYCADCPVSLRCSNCNPATYMPDGSDESMTCVRCRYFDYLGNANPLQPNAPPSAWWENDPTLPTCGGASNINLGTGAYGNPYNYKRCILAPAGTYVSALGQSSPTKCLAGTTSTVGSTGGCFNCPAGTFSDGNSILVCTKCQAGSWSGVAAAACTLCLPGSYSNEGASACSLCGAGTFASKSNSSSCLPCPAGTWAGPALFPGATSCAICPPGTYSLEGASFCTACPAGTFGASAGLTTSACSGQCPSPAQCKSGTAFPNTLACSSGDSRAVPVTLGLQIWPAAHPQNAVQVDLVVAPSALCAQMLSSSACGAAASIVGSDGIVRYVVGTAAGLNMESSKLMVCGST